MNRRDDLDLDDFRARLVARRTELERMVADHEAAGRPVELDQTRVGRLSRIDAMQNQAMALETERRRALEIQRIAAALARLEAGEFGCCVRCGEDIPARRMEFDPSTAVCVDCAG